MFILSGLSGCSLGVVPCVGAKLGPPLKARKHFFKVFFTVRKVLTCRAATPRDETPLARFQRAATVPACREHPRDAARTNLGGTASRALAKWRGGQNPLKKNLTGAARCALLAAVRGISAMTQLSEATRGRPLCADSTGGRFPFPASGAKASASEKRLQTVNLGNV